MMRCLDCKQEFENDDVVVHEWDEYQGECFGFPAYEHWCEKKCPYCDSEDIEEFDEDEEEDEEEQNEK